MYIYVISGNLLDLHGEKQKDQIFLPSSHVKYRNHLRCTSKDLPIRGKILVGMRKEKELYSNRDNKSQDVRPYNLSMSKT